MLFTQLFLNMNMKKVTNIFNQQPCMLLAQIDVVTFVYVASDHTL